MRFSVITVCLNAGESLLNTVEATLEQTFDSFEVLVKDGFSADGSVDRLPQDPRLRVIRQKDTGIYDAMNQAVAQARGDYLIFINAGDRFYRNTTLEEISRGIGQGRAELYYGNCYYRSKDQIRTYPHTISKMTCFRTMICHQAMVIRADVLREHPYDVSYRIHADRELLWYLVCEKKAQPRYIDTVIADYQGGGESSNPANTERNLRDEKRMLDAYYTKWEQIKYRFLIALTLPGLRRRLVNSPRLGKVYFAVTGLVHRILAGIGKLRK